MSNTREKQEDLPKSNEKSNEDSERTSEPLTDNRTGSYQLEDARRVTWPIDNRGIQPFKPKDDSKGKSAADDEGTDSSPPKKEERSGTSAADDEGTDSSPPNKEERSGTSPSNSERADSGPSKFPKSSFFVLFSSLCERFSFFGIKTVLVLYCSDQLEMDYDSAAALFHFFFALVFCFCIPGAIVADSCVGNFRFGFLIRLLSFVYAAGCIVLTSGSYPNWLEKMRAKSYAGLALTAIGSGSIMACVPAFGGCLVPEGEGQEKKRRIFFVLFYLVFYVGSIAGSVVTPLLRSDFWCSGQRMCYPLAFGVPAALACASEIIFVVGLNWYTQRPPQGNVLLKACRCACYAIGRKINRNGEKKPHWLDYADDRYDKELISDTKRILAILTLYLPLPVFWTLFHQMGSRWTQQAKLLDGYVFDLYTIKPDQMQAANPILIILFFPIFRFMIFPIFNKLRFLNKPLQRMTAGGTLAALAFVCAGVLQLYIDEFSGKSPSSGYSDLVFINNSPCRLQAKEMNATFEPFTNRILKDLPDRSYSFQLTPEACNARGPSTANINLTSQVESYAVNLVQRNLVGVGNRENKTIETEGRASGIKIYYNLNKETDPENASVIFRSLHTSHDISLMSQFSYGSYGVTEYKRITEGFYMVYVPWNSTAHSEKPVTGIQIVARSKYILSFSSANGRANVGYTFVELVPAGRLSILYQLIQYAVITAAEILLSITCLEFSYSEAPLRAQSVIQAAWLTTKGVGNLLVAVISAIHLFSLLYLELFFYAVLMVCFVIIFAIFAYFYEYVEEEEKRQSANEA